MGLGKIFFNLYIDARYSLKSPSRVVPTPLFRPFTSQWRRFCKSWPNFLALLTVTLFVLASLMVGPEFSNLGHSTRETWETFRCIYDATMQEQKCYQNCEKDYHFEWLSTPIIVVTFDVKP